MAFLKFFRSQGGMWNINKLGAELTAALGQPVAPVLSDDRQTLEIEYTIPGAADVIRAVVQRHIPDVTYTVQTAKGQTFIQNGDVTLQAIGDVETPKLDDIAPLIGDNLTGFLKYDTINGLRIKGLFTVSGLYPNGFDVYGEQLDNALFDGSRVSFQLAGPYISGYVQIILNGLWLKGGGTDYSEIATTNFVMAEAPRTGDAIRCRYLAIDTYETITETPSGSVDSSNTAFTTALPHISGSLIVWLNGVTHTPIDDYSNGGRSISFVTAPQSSDTGQAVYLLEKNSAIVPQETPGGAIDGSNVDFTLANTYEAGSLIVALNGVLQTITTDYTENMPITITFTAAPKTGDSLWVTYKIKE